MAGFMMMVVVILVGILVLGAGLRWMEPRRRSVEGSTVPPPAQLDRLESALGALEARVDDLQAQQRFLERLVAERPEQRSLAAGDEERERTEANSILFDLEPTEEDD